MEEYLLFADETKPTKPNPFFCFSGVSIQRTYYENIFITDVKNTRDFSHERFNSFTYTNNIISKRSFYEQ